MKKLAITTLALLVLAAPSLAGDTEDRFHAAYAKEVVEGDVKAAALEYLALMDDDSATDRLRAEARFRFAICAVLLGRPDEARSHLTGLIEAEGLVPPDIKKKAEEYLSSVSGVSVGTELDKKLQTLVFDLGRVSPYSTPQPAYRDFEIIGKQCLPFLRKLLHHSDANLRRHAFRLLCRMGEPGMGGAWDPKIGLRGGGFCQDLTMYFASRPTELAALEKRIVGLGDDGYRHVASMSPRPGFSLGFVLTLAGTEKWRRTTFELFGSAGTAEERNGLLIEWLDGEDGEMSRRAVSYLLGLGQHVPEAVATPGRFRLFLDRVIELGVNFQGTRATTIRQCLQTWLERVPPEDALAQMERVMAYGESIEDPSYTNPVMAGLATDLAGRVEKALPDGVDAAKYADLLKRWLPTQQRHYRLLMGDNYKNQAIPDNYLRQRWTVFLQRAPLDDAKMFASWIATLPADESGRRAADGRMFALRSPREVEVFVAAVKSAPADARPDLVHRTQSQRSNFSGETSRAWMAALLNLAPEFDARLTRALFADYARQSDKLPRKEAKEHLRKILSLLPDQSAEVRQRVLWALLSNHSQEYQVETAFPVFAESWDSIPERSRQSLLGGLLALVNNSEAGGATLGIEREKVVSFLSEHLGELTQQQLKMVTRYPQVFPPEEWIRYTQVAHPVHWHLVKQEERDRVAGALAENLADLTKTEVKFIVMQTSEKVRREIFTRGLAQKNREARSNFMPFVRATGPVPLTTVEKTLAVLIAEEPEDLSEISHLAEVVLTLRPSEKLFPVARLLLGSEGREDRLAGIRIAKSLGREDLVPDLAKLLDSMDAQIRGSAKLAIDSIREVQRIKDEEALKKAGMMPK